MSRHFEGFFYLYFSWHFHFAFRSPDLYHSAADWSIRTPASSSFFSSEVVEPVERTEEAKDSNSLAGK